MALPLLLTDLARRLLFNRWTLLVAVAAAMFAFGYFKGSASVKARQETQAVREAAETVVVQEKLEAAHDARVRKILSGPVPDSDAARMLSTWPDEKATAR